MPSRPSWVHIVVSWIGTLFLYLVGKTSFEQKCDVPASLSYRRRLSACVYAFWHRYQVFLAYAHRGERLSVLVSQSKDGEYIAQVMRRMGLKSVRGSTSRGGGEALRSMISLAESGEQIAFTPDGPRGPLQTVHGGVISAAQSSGQPVIPTATFSRRAIVFKSWDKFVLPMPLGINIVVHGQPFWIKSETPLDEAKEKVRRALNQVSDLATEANKHIPSFAALLIGQTLFFIYCVALYVLAPFILLGLIIAFGWSRSWKGLRERCVLQPINLPSQPRLWLHAASVGEWQALRPVIERLKKEKRFSLVVTATTPEARALIEKQDPELFVALLPVDMAWAVQRWIRKINPEALLIVETELWPVTINELSKRRIPIFIVNGRLSEKSFRSWTWLKPLIGRVLRQINVVYARSEEDQKHFIGLGLYPFISCVMGNTKSDNLVIVTPSEKSDLRMKLLGIKDDLILIAGSTWPGEEEMVIPALNSSEGKEWRLMLAPRRPERWDEVKAILAKQKLSWSLWSEVKKSGRWHTRILLVDTLGDLSQLYKTADLCFVGGSIYPRGGQNPLEPAAARLPLVYGSSMNNFKSEAAFMVERQGAVQIERYGDLLPTLKKIMADSTVRQKMASNAAAAIESLQGASEKIVQDFLTQMGYAGTK